MINRQDHVSCSQINGVAFSANEKPLSASRTKGLFHVSFSKLLFCRKQFIHSGKIFIFRNNGTIEEKDFPAIFRFQHVV